MRLTPEQWAVAEARSRSMRADMRAADTAHRIVGTDGCWDGAAPVPVKPAGAAAPPLVRRPSSAAPAAAPAPRESDIQSAILALLRQHPRVSWAARMNVGARNMAAPGERERWVQFAFRGCADIIGMLRGGRFLALECKSASGRVTTEQVEFLGLVARHGGLGIVARSVDDVVRALEEVR